MRIEYQPIRTWTLFFLPSFLLCALPDYLGITAVKEEWSTFRMCFDLFVSVAFWGGVLYSIYAVFSKCNAESEGQMNTQDLAIYIMATTSIVDLFLTILEKFT